jgi:poly(A) polymerase/tRNA nucleotidyltransferase (CCA-adding enzyme)
MNIPQIITNICSHIIESGYEAYIVGGCVRDRIRGVEPKDWDIATNALPEQILACFEGQEVRAVYENAFGTVGLVYEQEPLNSPLRTIEITTYRTEGDYSDSRHPDSVQFVSHIEDDLARRDFTVNAIAYNVITNEFVDPFHGIKDIGSMTLRTVGNPVDRFTEDALRIMRCIRFIGQLGFTCESETLAVVSQTVHLLENVSQERIRDEFVKIIESPAPAMSLMLLHKLRGMKYVIPELLEGDGCEQKGEHIYDVLNHLLYALQHAADKGYSFHVRLSALLHDIGKPRTRRYDPTKAGGKGKYTFYGHEVVGAKMSREILKRLKFSRETIEIIEKFVRWHMFFSDPEKITLSAVRRLIRNVSAENIWELMKVRECDRVGMNKVEAPYRLRKYFAMIEEVLHDPIDVKMLAINGDYMIAEMNMKPGRRMGCILQALLEEVIEDPSKNELMFLVKRVGELDLLSDKELEDIADSARRVVDDVESKNVQSLHVKHRV